MEEGWCDECNGLGTVGCFCGGDFCCCMNYGETDCPRCFGTGDDSEAEEL